MSLDLDTLFDVEYAIEGKVAKYLAEGKSSAREISELLIKNDFMESDRYSSGKPKIYPNVCMVLDKYLDKGYKVEIKSREDRIYTKSS